MAGSRANWEDMISAVTDKITSITKKTPEEKAEEASKKLGSGTAGKAAEAIRTHKERMKQMEEEAGI
ncbi:MAG: hypothetical protein DDT42_02142 [candidate division WS2 bacterium]|uniref:Uncharacterized protein n=1 Tax=Psychracetigena formicireducens TaxID=2986056 RepID=A0A9E2BKK5_PSYF1|nr:hypothetical protein [Candidatus Psychracetigena formicireducens]